MRRTAKIVLVAVALTLAVTTAASGAVKVMAQDEELKGRAYSDYLTIFWKTILGNEPDADPCTSVGGVRLLAGSGAGARSTFECTAPAGAPIYLSGPSTSCSTLEKPPFFGRTKKELKACANAQYYEAFDDPEFIIDGKPVKDPGSLVTGTGPFRFHMPKDNILGVRKRRGRAAAIGAGAIITGLPTGEHVLTAKARFEGDKVQDVYRLTVG